MLNFDFKNPTKIIFGKDTIAKLAEEIPSTEKVLLLYGGGSILQNGIYDRVDRQQTQVGVGAGSLQKVMPDAVEKRNGLLGVSYGNAALAAVIELAKRVVSLEKQLKSKE